MAARLNPSHDAATRDKIQTSQLINRLQSFAFGNCEMTGDQVRAALGLIKKTLPDLTQGDLNVKGNVTVEIVRYSDTASK